MTAAPLPPLPPAFGVKDDDVRPGGRSMVDLIADDHEQLLSLCDRLMATAPPSGGQRVEDVLVATLSRHLSAEEQYVYPAARKVLPDGGPLAERELTEDATLLRTLARLHATPQDDATYAGIVDALAGQVRRHAERAGDGLLPRLQETCTDNELIRLGNRVQIAREAAPTRPHPSTPSTPPLNKVVDPAIGVVDKVRDAFARRTTWPEDL